jgi:hypothetical protein
VRIIAARAARAGGQQRDAKRFELGLAAAFEQREREMRAHAGTQHLGRPQGNGALERQHLQHTESRRAAQHAADVARVLQAVEHHAGGACLHGRRRRQVENEADASRRFQRAQAGTVALLEQLGGFLCLPLHLADGGLKLRPQLVQARRAVCRGFSGSPDGASQR